MFDSPLSASAYEVLDVAVTADAETLRRAYRARLRQTHPDTGGDAAAFVQVQQAWELVGTPEARAAYDRGHGFGDAAPPSFGGFRAERPPADTRPRARSHGQPGGWRRERYLTLIREWVGRGVEVPDPYDPALVRSAPWELKRLLADALAEEQTARTVADLGMGYTVWHDVAAGGRSGDPDAKLDHVVLGPSGLFGILSEDFGAPVGLRRGELVGDGVPGDPIAELLGRMRVVAKASGVRFTGALVVLPDDDVVEEVQELGRVRGVPVAVVARSALARVLRTGLTGGRVVGGNELFDSRTRLDRAVRFV